MPTIVKGSDHMQVVTYTGNGSTQTIDCGFKPDLVWIKIRSAAGSHRLLDSVRGATNALSSNLTNAEFVDSTGVTAFTSTGFTVGADGSYNGSGSTYVAWCWKAGQGTTSTNTNGTITSTVSVNASAGFSIVTYTGSSPSGTVGHGLGVAPSLIIVKQRNTGGNSWPVWFSGVTSSTQYLYLNGTNAVQTSVNIWNSTLPTSSVFSVGNDSVTNTTGSTYVAYCWTPIAGYSTFGSYTGNGSSDGTFVYTGFRPRYVMMKRTTGAGNWFIYDTTRSTYNLSSVFLYANLSDSEVSDTTNGIDILSNGFKLRVVGNYQPNTNGETFIYIAFAENPFKNALAR